MAISDTLKPNLDQIIDRLKLRVADGKITLAELYSMFIESIGDIAVIGGSAKDLTDDDIKAISVHLAKRIYDEVIAPINLPFVPDWLEPTIDAAGSNLMEPVVSGMVTGVLKIVRKFKPAS